MTNVLYSNHSAALWEIQGMEVTGNGKTRLEAILKSFR